MNSINKEMMRNDLGEIKRVWCFSSVSGATSGLSLGRQGKSDGALVACCVVVAPHLAFIFGGTPHTFVFPFSAEHEMC